MSRFRTTKEKSRFTSGFGALITTALVIAMVATPLMQTQDKKQAIWERAEPALMEYMKESAGIVAQGHALAYSGFGDWYTNTLIPALDNDPPIVKLAQFVFEAAVKLGSNLIPGPAIFGKAATQLFITAFREATTEVAANASTATFLAKLNMKMELAKTNALTLARRFEAEHPSDFEAAMFAYLNEEVATPNVHAASDFGIGAVTRKKLAQFGFPEPSEEGAPQIAESLLTPMILAVKDRHFRDRLQTLDAGQRRIDAQIAARRVLYPNDLRRICKDAFRLGLLAPSDCR